MIKTSVKIAVGIFVCLYVFFVPVAGHADTVVRQGTCGPDASWVIDESGALIVSGKGIVNKNFDEDKTIPEITSVTVSEGITEIGDRAFYGVSSGKNERQTLERVTLPSTVKKIGEYAFACNYEMKKVYWSEGLEIVEKSAFQNCERMEGLVLPDSIKEIGQYAFSRCKSIKTVHIPAQLEVTGEDSFHDCENLQIIHFSSAGKLKTISPGSFYGCKIKKTMIPDSVTDIGTSAFGQCKYLKTIGLGKSVKRVKKWFLHDCPSLKKVINHSGAEFVLDDAKGCRTWRVNGKKVRKIKGGQTAVAKGKKFTIKWHTDKGKPIKKLPKSYRYGEQKKLPSLRRSGYTFFGWNISGKGGRDWYLHEIPIGRGTDLKAYAIFKKYEVKNIKGRKIKVTVKDPLYGKKGYVMEDLDQFMMRYSEYSDMRNAKIVCYTAPYGKGCITGLKKGKVYYVQVGKVSMYEEDDEDYEEPAAGWIMKRKVKIKK